MREQSGRPPMANAAAGAVPDRRKGRHRYLARFRKYGSRRTWYSVGWNPNSSYGFNSFLVGNSPKERKKLSFTQPRTFLMADAWWSGGVNREEGLHYVHANHPLSNDEQYHLAKPAAPAQIANVLFGDGHVEGLRFDQVPTSHVSDQRVLSGPADENSNDFWRQWK